MSVAPPRQRAERVRRLAAAVHAGLLDGARRAEGDAAIDLDDLDDLVLAADPLLDDEAAREVVQLVRSLAHGLGPLDPLVSDDDVTEVMVNGDGSVWVERRGRLERRPEHLGADEVLAIIERITAPLGVHADRRHPVVDARLPDGARVHAVIPPLAVDGPCLTIRRFRVRAVALDELCPSGAVAGVLRAAVQQRRNILISGGTGAGKTTLLNALAGCSPGDERVVTIEDTAELRLPGAHVVRLEARPAAPDGVGEVPIAELVRAALRMRPDRIVVGEVRGAEALAMLAAMNTGHEGSMTTCHANAPTDALRRVEALAAGAGTLPLGAVRDQLRAAIDVVVQVRRLADGRRQVVAVDEVDEQGADGASLRAVPLVVGERVVRPFARPPRVPCAPPGGAR